MYLSFCYIALQSTTVPFLPFVNIHSVLLSKIDCFFSFLLPLPSYFLLYFLSFLFQVREERRRRRSSGVSQPHKLVPRKEIFRNFQVHTLLTFKFNSQVAHISANQFRYLPCRYLTLLGLSDENLPNTRHEVKVSNQSCLLNQIHFGEIKTLCYINFKN